MAKFSVTCKQQCCTVPELRDSLKVLSSHQPCELKSCWDQRSSSKKALAWARGQESSSASGWWDGGGRGQWGQQQGPHLVPERGQCLAASIRSHTKHLSAKMWTRGRFSHRACACSQPWPALSVLGWMWQNKSQTRIFCGCRVTALLWLPALLASRTKFPDRRIFLEVKLDETSSVMG